MSYDESEVLAKLQQKRKEAGFTQKAVEERLNLRPGTIYDYEKGRLKISLELAWKLCQLYGIDISSLVIGNAIDQRIGQTENAVSQLVQLGIITNKRTQLIDLAWEDPIIVAEIGLNNQQTEKPLLLKLLEKLTANQQQSYIVEVYRYVNSLIGCDKKITDMELRIRNAILDNSPIVLTEKELLSIKKAFTQRYFGKSLEKSFPRDAFKHFLIWVLMAVGLSDGQLNHSEEEYIRSVAESIRLKKSSLEFIFNKIHQTEP